MAGKKASKKLKKGKKFKKLQTTKPLHVGAGGGAGKVGL